MSKIKEIRLAKELTLEDVAKGAGTSIQQVQRLENGQRKLTAEWVRKLARGLRVNPSEIDEEIGLMEEIRALEQEEKKLVRNYVEFLRQNHGKHGTQ